MQKSATSRAVTILVFILMTLYSAWSWFFQIGLYGLLVRLQFNLFELHYPIATGIVMWVVLAVIPLSSLYTGKRRHEFELRPAELATRLRIRSASLFVWFLLLSALAGASYHLSSQIPDDDAPAVAVDATWGGTDSLWQFGTMWFTKVSITGDGISDSVVLRQDELVEGTTVFRRYIPIRTHANPSTPIQFVESFRSDSVNRVNRNPVTKTGYVLPKALPVLVRHSFEEDGINTAKYTYLISTEVIDGKTLLRILSAIMAIIALFLLVALLHSPFHSRQKLKAQREHLGSW
ncbi:hypothetical protein [Arenicella xantha]|uniref:Uncharacterized protein n=1 Tax=Arenicella xantha TaxID=644221 RepID=A0A395JG78_9GAMM|nr:hypothetical protein [Arenicella xantha]RBP48782.1 hypothetical protein DFR28_105121 [Arenicella xantha]